MPKTKGQEIIFGIMMVSLMVYGMVVYNISIATGGISADAFIEALKELPIMIPIAFAVEFFLLGRVAKKMAFAVINPSKNPGLVPFAISICTCLVMCPTMSLIATLLFNEPSFLNWLKAFGLNLPMALLYQLLICGPFVRFIFRHIFPNKEKQVQ